MCAFETSVDMQNTGRHTAIDSIHPDHDCEGFTARNGVCGSSSSLFPVYNKHCTYIVTS
jgi:hypothetical protein